MQKRWFHQFVTPGIDYWLIGAAFLLSVLGVLLIHSATHNALDPDLRGLAVRQLVWFLLALILSLALFCIPLRIHEAFAYVYYLIGIGALALVLIAGSTRMGATRWFELGPLNLQPSELAKIATVIGLARFFSYSKKSITRLPKLSIVIIMIVVPAGLILFQPDLGTALVFCALGLAMLYWSGIPIWYLALVISPVVSLICAFHWLAWATFFAVLLYVLYKARPGVLLGTTVIIANLLFGMVTPLIWNRLHDYQKTRILIFLDPGRDPQGAGYQLIQSKVAIGSGGIFGKGFMHGSQTKLAFLPAQHTDFIFTVVGEEFGLLGIIVILFLLGFIIFRSLQYAIRCRNLFSSYVALGLTSILVFQIFVNIGMTAGLMPVTGLPLPFLSYGGTSLITSWIIIGLLVKIGYNWQEY